MTVSAFNDLVFAPPDKVGCFVGVHDEKIL